MHCAPFLQDFHGPGGLIDAFGAVAAALPDKRALGVLTDSDRIARSFSYSQLAARVASLGERIAERIRPGGRVLVACEPGADFVTAFLGVVYAGGVAVPVPVPRFANQARRVERILDDASASAIILRDPGLLQVSGAVAVIDPEPDAGADPGAGVGGTPWLPRRRSGSDLAFIQYTSGSTSAPKGVTVTHASVLANSELLGRALGYDADSVSLTWLPPSHDMGLVEGLLQPILHGVGALVMAPETFLRRPLRWLRAIDRFRVTNSGGPNFAYQLCIDHAAGLKEEVLDLSCWRLAYVGAEPIRHAVLRAFSESYAPSGFASSAFYAAYGLAEATLLVSTGPVETLTVRTRELERGIVIKTDEDADDARTLVCCGTPYPEMQVAILDPETGDACGPDRVGEVCIAGTSVTAGYWAGEGVPPQADRVTGPDGTQWLRTGDLGFLDAGRVVITGRLKDLIIVKGRNLLPHDVELAVKAANPALRRMPVAFDAFGLPDFPDGGLVVAAEVASADPAAFDALCASTRRAVAEEFEAECAAIIAVARGEVEYTTSGKVMRGALRQRFGADALEVLAVWRNPGLAETSAVIADSAGVAALLTARFGPLEGLQARTLAELGGDSVFALQVCQAVATAGGRLLQSAQALRMTVAEIAAAALERGVDPDDAGSQDQRGSDAQPQRAIPATAAQRGMYFLSRMWGDRDPFVLTFAGRLTAGAGADRFARALTALIARHPLLGSRFGDSGSDALVEFVPVGDPDALVRILDDPAGVGFEAACASPPPLAPGTLFAGTIYRADGAPPCFLIRIHHAVADAASLAVAWRDLSALYAGNVLPAVRVCAAEAEQGEIARHGKDAHAFWLARLAGAPLHFELPPDHPRPLQPSFAGARSSLVLDAARTVDITAMASRHAVSPAAICLAVFAAVCLRQTDSRDMVVGIPVHRRGQGWSEDEIGLVARTVLARIALEPGATTADLIRAADQALFDAQMQQPFLADPLLKALDAAQVDSAPVPRLLFNWLAEGESAAALSGWAAGLTGARIGQDETNGTALSAEVVEAISPPAYHDLTLHIAVVNGEFRLAAHYARDLFRPARIERLLDQFAVLLAAMAAEPEAELAALPALGQAEQDELDRIAGPDGSRAPPVSLGQLFRAQAARSPAAEAAVCSGQSLTYAALDDLSDALAVRLQAMGVRPGDRVGIHLERDVQLIAAKLAVFKCGAAYVPMDPRYPAARLEGMIEDARAEVIITRTVPDWMGQVRTVDPEADGARHLGQTPNLVEVPPDSPAYILFTSGTTGRPKGVVISHRSAAGLLAWAHDEFGDALERVFASTSSSFDLSVFETFAPLTWGGTVIVAESLLALPEMADAFRPTLASGVPSVFAALLERGSLPPLKALAVAGEPLGPDLADRLLLSSPGAVLYDLYGPTEVTTYATGGERQLGDRATIGRPLPWTRTYLLDRQMQQVPIGATGEIWLGGDRLAQGYFGRSGWTADRFRPDPFVARRGALMYRTGDAGTFRPDGTLIYKGRLDRQIKLRGYRIEQSEIEAVIESHPDVSQGAVLVLPGANGPAGDRLVACIAPLQGVTDSVLRHAASRLPAFMVPAGLFEFESLPVTPNGKLDRPRVAEMAARAARAGRLPARAEPMQEIAPQHRQVADIIARATGIEGIDARTSPFALGATSLDAVRIQQALRGAFGTELSLRTIIADGSAQALAELLGPEVTARNEAEPSSTRQPQPPQIRSLHFAERQLLAASTASGDGSAFHIPLLLQLPQPTSAERIERAVARLVDHHAVLRQRLTGSGAEVSLVPPGTVLPVVRLAAEPPELLPAFIRKPFDLVQDAPLRIGAIGRPDRVRAVAIIAHHLFLDGASLAFIVPDLLRWIADPDHVSRPVLAGTLPTHGTREAAALAYWRDQLRGAAAAVLPAGGGDPDATDVAGATRRMTLSEGLTQAVRARAAGLGMTPFTVLLAAFAVALCKRGGQRDMVIAVPYDLRISAGCEGTVGMFAQPVLVRIVLESTASDDLIGQVRMALVAALEHGTVAFEDVLGQLPAERAFGDSFYRILFASQDGLDAAVGGLGDGTRLQMLDAGGARADLTALLKTDGEGPIELAFEYRRALFGADEIDSLLALWSRAAEQLVAASAVTLPGRDQPMEPGPSRHALRLGEALQTSEPVGHGAVHAAVAEAWEAVLGQPPQPGESFFAAGGDSLGAVRLLGRIERELGLRVSLREFYGRTTYAELAASIAALSGSDRPAGPALPPQQMAGLNAGPLSLAQQQILFFERLLPGQPLYNVGLAYELVGPLDRKKLASALASVVSRYPALRLRIDANAVPGRQTVAQASLPPDLLQVLRSGKDPLGTLRRFLALPFDLANASPFRAGLLRTGPDRHVLALSAHHAAVDAQSLALVTDEIGRVYRGETLAAADPFGPVEYAVWEQHCLSGPVVEEARAQWRERLRGVSPALDLPVDPADQSGAGTVLREIDPVMAAALRQRAEADGTGIVAVVLAAFAQVLAEIAGKDTVVVGLPVNTRRVPHLDCAGFFSNTVPLAISNDADLPQLVRQTRSAISAAQDLGWLPLPLIVDEWQPPRDGRRPALFNALFAMETGPTPEILPGGTRRLTFDLGYARCDLLLMARVHQQGIELQLQHATLQEPDLADRVLNRLVAVLETFAAAETGHAPVPDSTRKAAHAAGPVDLEGTIGSIWSQVLDLAPIPADRSFFDLGGSSLQLVEVQVRLESALAREVPLSLLFSHPRIGDLADALCPRDDPAAAAVTRPRQHRTRLGARRRNVQPLN